MHAISYEQFTDWLVPILLSGIAYFLNRISKEMSEIGRSLAVNVERTSALEKRVDRLEDNHLRGE